MNSKSVVLDRVASRQLVPVSVVNSWIYVELPTDYFNHVAA